MSNVATINNASNSPRYFTPTQSLKEQKEILHSLIKTAKPNGPAFVHLFTPQLSEYVVQTLNGGNRPKKVKQIELYADAMADNDWPVTGATIVFGKSGRVLDGQHRLIACIRSGQPFMTYVVFGIDDSNFTRIDTGRRRTNIDAFSIAGVPHANVAAKAARWVSILADDPTNRAVSYTNDELLHYYKNDLDRDRFDRCVKLAIEIEKKSKATSAGPLPAGAVAGLLYYMAEISSPGAEEFAELLKSGKKQPAKAIYANIAEAKDRSGGRINEVYRNAVIVKGWNSFRSGKTATKASLDYSMGDEFPDFE